MKIIDFTLISLLFPAAALYSSTVTAASSGTISGPDYTMTCWSLQIISPPQPGWRRSRCLAESPTQNLSDLEVTLYVEGHAVWNAGNSYGYPACSPLGFGSPYQDSDTRQYPPGSSGGTSGVVDVQWYYNIKELSFNDNTQGRIVYDRIAWAPPLTNTGDEFSPWYLNTNGTCW